MIGLLQTVAWGIAMVILTLAVVFGPMIAAGLLRKREENQ